MSDDIYEPSKSGSRMERFDALPPKVRAALQDSGRSWFALTMAGLLDKGYSEDDVVRIITDLDRSEEDETA